MTDITKAIAFARECLKWESPISTDLNHGAVIIYDEAFQRRLEPKNTDDIRKHLETFLGKRFFIQINRGTTSLFKWSVIVGPQNLLGGPPNFEHGRGDSDGLYDALFDACVRAAHLFGVDQ